MYSDFMTTILTEASEIARRNFGKVVGSSKTNDNNQVLTDTDIEIGHLLTSRTKTVYPEYNIIDEELGIIDNGSRFTWVFDPIDGTSNFASGVPTYGIMVGLLRDETPIAGGVVLPEQQELYIAEEGKGAFCNGRPLHVAPETRLLSSLVAFGIDGQQDNPQSTRDEMALYAEIVLGIRNLRTSNSTAFDVMMVASGRYGAAMYKGRKVNSSKIWDNVGPQIIVTEAGGLYTDFYGDPISYANPLQSVDGYSRCAGAPVLHEQLQDIIRRHL